MGEVFVEIRRGGRLTKENQKQGKIPYVSSSALNNGIDNFIANKDGVRRFENCISLANSGSVGSAFFHPYKFIASDHVTQLVHSKSNKYIYLFFLPIISRLSEKYGFNREINAVRIKREKILLPTNSKGEIDYEYMETYMKKLEKKLIKKIIIYCQSRIA